MMESEWIHVTDGRDIYIFEAPFENYCGDSGNGQATFEVNNLTDVNYLKNLSSVSITPYFGCSSFVPQKYMIALGDSAKI